MSVLFFHTMKYTTAEPRSPASDRFVLSKGHAAPALYAAWAEAGLIPVDELKKLRFDYEQLDSRIAQLREMPRSAAPAAPVKRPFEARQKTPTV